METSIATVVFLRRGDSICLAPKRNKIHTKGRTLDKSATLNGYGGKLEPDETILGCARRELQDESGVSCNEKDLKLVADIGFIWPGNVSAVPNMRVFVFFLDIWKGEPHEGVEMGTPQFHHLHSVPYERMMPGDRSFLPLLFEGETLVGTVRFLEGGQTEVDLVKMPVTLP